MIGPPVLHPRHNPDAEASLCGAVFLAADVLDRVELAPDDFYDPRMRLVWEASLSLHATKRPIDPVTLEENLGPEKVRACGGISFISDLIAATPTADNAEHYAAIVRQDALTRRSVVALSELIFAARKGETIGAELLSAGFAALQRLSVDVADNTVGMPQAVRETMAMMLEALERKADGKPVVWGLSTGFQDLDFLLGGLTPGIVTIVAARPGMGKSAFARSLAEAVNAADMNENGVHVFSLEDTLKPYVLRQLSDFSRVNLQKLRGLDGITRGDISALMDASNRLLERKTWLIDDSAGISHAQIAMRTRKHRQANKTKLVVIDYVQLVKAVEIYRDPRQGLIEVAYALQAFARNEGVAVLLLSQLNRDCEKRPDKRPMLSDLRESGVLEEIGKAIMFIFRDEYYTKDESKKPGITEVIVAKNSHGQTGSLEYAWDAATATVRPLYRRQPDAPPHDDGEIH